MRVRSEHRSRRFGYKAFDLFGAVDFIVFDHVIQCHALYVVMSRDDLPLCHLLLSRRMFSALLVRPELTFV